jgi:hypothetical protein
MSDNPRDALSNLLTLADKAVIMAYGGTTVKAKMPSEDIPNRAALERELAREIGKVQAAQVGKLLELMGDPPNMANVPQSFWDEAGEALRQTLSRFLTRTYLQRASQIMQQTTIGVDWALINERAASWSSRYSFDLVGGINDTSRELLQSSIDRYFRDSLTREELEAGIRGAFGDVRAEMIAVTEITRAASAGEHELADQIMQDNPSLEMVAIWQTNEDELVCEICGPNNDKRRGEGWQDDPPAHPRCRCWLNHDMRIRTEKAMKYSDDQPRDEQGQWTSGGGGGATYGDTVANDPHAQENASMTPGKRKMPGQMTKEEYEKLPVVYRGEREGSSQEGHVFVSNDRNLAQTHGKVKEFRILPGSKIYPDPEIEGFEDRTLSGNESLSLGSAVINYDDMVLNLPYSWYNR